MPHLSTLRPRHAARLLLTGCAAALFLTGCGATRSTVRIGPGEQFVLGGDESRSFRVLVQNLGPGPVEVVTRGSDGAEVVVGVLNPRESRSVRFQRGSAAVLSNLSEFVARVAVEIRGGGDLGMGYTDIE